MQTFLLFMLGCDGKPLFPTILFSIKNIIIQTVMLNRR
ncbi:hypothetical protein DDI_2450 [Dickeya dianthicola RNS04.9]|nr:hypothetical protein DDI_2450 [Dickeya dianthicola RNS04.9]